MPSASSVYGYDNDGNLTSLTDTSATGATLAGYTWTYPPVAWCKPSPIRSTQART